MVAYFNPADAVYFVEGCGQGVFGANWGDGFVTDPSLIRTNSSNDPTGFFTAVVENDFKCGPTIQHFNDGFLEQPLNAMVPWASACDGAVAHGGTCGRRL